MTDGEEKELSNFLVGCSRIGYARSRKQVISLVGGIVAKKTGRKPGEVTITTGWWNSFKKHHPQLTLRTASCLAYSRAVANDPEVIENYFDLLEETLRQNGILD